MRHNDNERLHSLINCDGLRRRCSTSLQIWPFVRPPLPLPPLYLQSPHFLLRPPSRAPPPVVQVQLLSKRQGTKGNLPVHGSHYGQKGKGWRLLVVAALSLSWGSSHEAPVDTHTTPITPFFTPKHHPDALQKTIPIYLYVQPVMQLLDST